MHAGAQVSEGNLYVCTQSPEDGGLEFVEQASFCHCCGPPLAPVAVLSCECLLYWNFACRAYMPYMC